MLKNNDTVFKYDKIASKTVDGVKINYGIICGNEKIIFIKTGADGNVNGYNKKYLKMAYKAHDKLGATVICASNPYVEKDHVLADKEMVLKILADMNCSKYKISFFGASDGAYHNLFLAKEFIKNTDKILCVNTSTVAFDDLEEKIINLSNVDKILVYGDKDDEYCYVPKIKEKNWINFDLIVIEGADHEFKGMIDEYINLIELL